MGLGAWVFGALFVLLLAWVGRHYRSVLRGDFRHAEGHKSVWFVPGNGGRGGSGGQVPPLVPEDPEFR